MARGKRERLFGAAVLLRKLEKAGLKARGTEVYEGVLEDLELVDEEVQRFLENHLDEIDEALAGGGEA